MNDILPTESIYWQWVEQHIRQLVKANGYGEIRTPVLEMTGVFTDAIGETTDIVEKEMYTFHDRNGDSLSLRPEGTASCVRAGIEHGLFYNQTQRLWYLGPMFRHERPQKGRYRQFYQFGAEAYGFPGADIEAELLILCRDFLQRIGLSDATLQINNIGGLAERQRYRQALQTYFRDHFNELDDDSKQRLEKNPLRILDSKNPALDHVKQHAPTMQDYLLPETAEHFAQLQEYLTAANIPYTINPHLVRGLDYYTGLVFEWVTDRIGTQGTICAGGRYDNLIATHGGKATPAVGFAAGMERLLLLLQDNPSLKNEIEHRHQPDIYMIMVGEAAKVLGLRLSSEWRQQFPRLTIINHCGEGNLKSQFKKADKSAAKFAIILGEDELRDNTITIKPLRGGEQETIAFADIHRYLHTKIHS
ncbi:MAG: histidine--tRNA ligase [Legionellales bacterium]|nr:histidine--tRNA ligase [Legionellales bacterium]